MIRKEEHAHLFKERDLDFIPWLFPLHDYDSYALFVPLSQQRVTSSAIFEFCWKDPENEVYLTYSNLECLVATLLENISIKIGAKISGILIGIINLTQMYMIKDKIIFLIKKER